jgi:hypothetical protein
MCINTHSHICSAPAAAPLNVRATAESSSAIRLQWEPVPAALRQGIIVGYTISCQTPATQENPATACASDTDVPVEDEAGPPLTFTMTNLHAFTEYQFHMAARTLVGAGPPSVPVVQVCTYY